MDKFTLFIFLVTIISISHANRQTIQITQQQQQLNTQLVAPPILTTPCEPECNSICTEEYEPVCGQNCEGDQVTFSNMCKFNYEQCSRPDQQWVFLYWGQCEYCNPLCPRIYQPICARDCNGDHITFSNLCEFQYEKCLNPDLKLRYVYNGPCRNCNFSCRINIQPICGRDCNGNIKLFESRCEFESRRCLYADEAWSFVCDGECPLELD